MESPSRCEAFSDGVFAIAITLLILEIRLPHGSAEGHLSADLVALWPSYLAFALSFFVIVVSWIAHHYFTPLLRAVNRPFLLANAFFLFYVTCIPFSTSVLASHLTGPEVHLAVAFYASIFIFGGVASLLMVEAAARGNLFHPGVDSVRVGHYRRAHWTSIVVNVSASLLALVAPMVSLAIIFLVRVAYLRLHYEMPPPAPRQSAELGG